MGVEHPVFEMDDEELLRRALPDVDIELLQKQGFTRLDLPEELLPYRDGGFGNPDGKAHLFSKALAAAGHDALPTYTPAVKGPGSEMSIKYPLALLTPKNHTRFLNTTYSKHHSDREKGPYFEIDPHDAIERGIAEGDLVRVFNRHGSLELPARISDRLRPGLCAIPWGWWGPEANANALDQ